MDRRKFIQNSIAAASVVGLPSFTPAENSGEENEQMFDDALSIIQELAGNPFHSSGVRTAIDSINQIGEWGHCAMYTSMFSNDPQTRKLAVECMVSDRESYYEYWPFFTDLDEHEDEQIKRLAPALLQRLREFRENELNSSIG